MTFLAFKNAHALRCVRFKIPLRAISRNVLSNTENALTCSEADNGAVVSAAGNHDRHLLAGAPRVLHNGDPAARDLPLWRFVCTAARELRRAVARVREAATRTGRARTKTQFCALNCE